MSKVKSEIAEKAARHVVRKLELVFCDALVSDQLRASMEIECTEVILEAMSQGERAIAESQAPQPRTLTDLDWDTICAERDHWRAIAVKAVPGCNAPFGEDEDITMEDVIGKKVELGDGEPSPAHQFSTEEQEINALAPGTIRNPASGGAQEVSPHHYISTACLHGQHEKCRRFCKYCEVPCACKNCAHVEEVSPPSPEPKTPRTKAELINWLSEWRQKRGGSVSEHNHRRLLQERTVTELNTIYQQIVSQEASLLANTTTRIPCGVQDHAEAAHIVGEQKDDGSFAAMCESNQLNFERAEQAEGDTRELKAALEEARIKLLQHLTPSPEGNFRRAKTEDVDWYLQFEAKASRLLG